MENKKTKKKAVSKQVSPVKPMTAHAKVPEFEMPKLTDQSVELERLK